MGARSCWGDVCSPCKVKEGRRIWWSLCYRGSMHPGTDSVSDEGRGSYSRMAHPRSSHTKSRWYRSFISSDSFKVPYISVAMLCFSWHIQVCRVLYLNMSVVWKHNSMEVWLQWLIFHWRPYISVKPLINYSAPSFVFMHQSTGVLSTILSTGLVSKWALSHAVWSTHRY